MHLYRFYFEDTLAPVEWWDHPDNKAGPWPSALDALRAFYDSGMGAEPSDACYLLLTEAQADKLRGRA